MTRYVSSHNGRTMRPEPYDMNYGDDEEDEDDDFDDEDLDGYDGLSDYDEEDEPTHRSGARHAMATSPEDRVNGLGDLRRSIGEGSGSMLEPGDDNRRDHHNQLERKRRASIKTSYNDLREAIPSLRGSKASRAVILQRAVEFIKDLHKQYRDHTHCVETLRRQNDLLDSRVQELQRLVQRLDGEEAAAAEAAAASSTSVVSHNSVTGPGVGSNTAASGGCVSGATLRLVSSNINSPGVTVAGSGTTHLPVYRLMPQGSSLSDRTGNNNGVTHVLTSATNGARSNVLGTGHHNSVNTTSTIHARTRVSPALNATTSSSTFNGLNVLNTAVSLVASAHSAFSSTSSLAVSSGDVIVPHPSSQRSSPVSYSSTSSTSSSLGNHTTLRPIHAPTYEELCEDGSAASAIDTIIISGQRKDKQLSTRCSSASSSISSSSPPAPLLPPAPLPSASLSNPSSPPSIVLAVPLRHAPTNTAPREEELVSKRQRLN